MHRSLSLVLVLVSSVLFSATAWCIGIAEVLDRSHIERLASMKLSTDSERIAVVQKSFERIRARIPSTTIELRVITGSVTAECLLDRVVVADAALADASEPVRIFILAHEVGHAQFGHWKKLTGVYQKYIPGEVVKEETDKVAPALGREASKLSREHELAADAFAAGIARSYSFEDIVGAVMLRGMQMPTATHPGTGQRRAQLQELFQKAE